MLWLMTSLPKIYIDVILVILFQYERMQSAQTKTLIRNLRGISTKIMKVEENGIL